ncbi:helix-turn-helix domain-containing protein [Sinorhizobium medicae]|nr:helix-turn-helix domain-containing protein [Sinorhizobium medicae]
MSRQHIFNCCSKDIRYVRMSKGLTIEQVSSHIGEPVSALEEYENNPSTLPLDVAVKMLKMYQVPFNSVCFGERLIL